MEDRMLGIYRPRATRRAQGVGSATDVSGCSELEGPAEHPMRKKASGTGKSTGSGKLSEIVHAPCNLDAMMVPEVLT